jgi:hypothetical protein
MNRYKTESNGAVVNPIPLFSSSWLALFYLLRKNFNERRGHSTTSEGSSQRKVH